MIVFNAPTVSNYKSAAKGFELHTYIYSVFINNTAQIAQIGFKIIPPLDIARV